MHSIVAFSLRFRTALLAVSVLIAALGVWQIQHASVETVPEFSPLTLEVKTEALGLSAAEVESLITVPLEADLLNGVPWMESIQSESSAGLSSIEMFFVPGTNLMQARQMVDERLAQTRALPNVSTPPTLLQPVSSAGRLMNIGLTSTKVSLVEMSVLARWEIAPRLMGVPGVANVAIWGQRDRQLQVQVDPEILQKNKVTLEQIIKTAGEAVWESPLTYLESSTPGTGGFIDTPNQRLSIRHLQPLLTPAEFAKIPVAGSKLMLGSVAKIAESYPPSIGSAVFRDGPGLMLVVDKLPGFNTVAVTRRVEEALAELRPAMSGIEVNTTIFRPASFIEQATGNIARVALAAAVLVSLVLVIMLRSWRAALAAITAIATSLLAASLVLTVSGGTITTMNLIALLMAVGVVASDTVMDVENVRRRLYQRHGPMVYIGTLDIIISAALESRRPAVYATIIVILAALPALFVGWPLAGFLRPLMWSYLVAVAVSFIVSFTVTPALSGCLMGRRAEPSESGAETGQPGRTMGLLGFATRTVPIAYAGIGLGVIACLVGFSRIHWTLLPEFAEPTVVVELQAPSGTSLPAMERIASQLVRDIRAIPGVGDAAAQVGRAALSRESADVDTAELSISMDPAADYEDTIAAIEKAVRSHPGLTSNVEPYLSARLRQGLAGDDKALTVRVYGQDPVVLSAKAKEIRDLLSKVDGVANPAVESQLQSPTIQIEVDLDKAAQYGLKPGDVRRATSAFVSGITVGSLFQDQKVFSVVVWGTPNVRDNLTNVQNLLIDTQSGQQVRLRDVASVRIASALAVIRRQGVSQRLDVEASVVGRSGSDVRREVAERIGNEISFPFEYHAEVLGEAASARALLISAAGYFVAAAALILLVLQAALRSWRLTMVAVAGFPMVVGGTLVAIGLAGDALSLSSLIGCAVALTVALRSGLALVLWFETLERRETERGRNVLVLEGLRDRLPGILATCVVTAACFLPFVFFQETAGLEFIYPVAVAVTGGMAATVLLTALVVPALYLKFGAGTAARSALEDAALDGAPVKV